jgi:hypothetical protein
MNQDKLLLGKRIVENQGPGLGVDPAPSSRNWLWIGLAGWIVASALIWGQFAGVI